MQIHNIDLHYHAGQERQAGVTLTEYIDYAQKTARKILGITDHYHLYPKFPLKLYRGKFWQLNFKCSINLFLFAA